MTGEPSVYREEDDRTAPAPGDVYEISFKGHLGKRWAGRFPDYELIRKDDGTTLIVGPVIDQSALYGLINQVRDLGLELISVNRVCKED